MKYGEVLGLLDEAGFSPENLAKFVSVSNSTYRRWQKEPLGDVFPKEYESNIASGLYKLLENKSLSFDSPRVNSFVENHIPEFFQAAVGRLTISGEIFAEDFSHQDKITSILSNLGNSSTIRSRVDKATRKLKTFLEWGAAWKYRIKLLMDVTRSRELALVDRLVAYGALFYLILPLDLVPDSIPVFGYVDDFGILGFATAYYCKRFPEMEADASIRAD
jgi:uncharacterized membrane protein YkvA (DUF1232 family)